jgi:hypothetical protein
MNAILRQPEVRGIEFGKTFIEHNHFGTLKQSTHTSQHLTFGGTGGTNRLCVTTRVMYNPRP